MNLTLSLHTRWPRLTQTKWSGLRKQSTSCARSHARKQTPFTGRWKRSTPFYGWGLAARIETTALAVQAMTLAASKEQQNGKDSEAKNEEMISRGLLSLLRQKDRYGVWYSTQATINVLDALTAVLSSRDTNAAQKGRRHG